MRLVCYICKILYGIKEPLNDNRETHGLCPECFKLEMAKLEPCKENTIDSLNKKKPTS